MSDWDRHHHHHQHQQHRQRHSFTTFPYMSCIILSAPFYALPMLQGFNQLRLIVISPSCWFSWNIVVFQTMGNQSRAAFVISLYAKCNVYFLKKDFDTLSKWKQLMIVLWSPNVPTCSDKPRPELFQPSQCMTHRTLVPSVARLCWRWSPAPVTTETEWNFLLFTPKSAGIYGCSSPKNMVYQCLLFDIISFC